MQVAHGNTFLYTQYLDEQKFDYNRTDKSQFRLLTPFGGENQFADPYLLSSVPKESDVRTSVLLPPTEEKWDCISSLELRSQLLKVSSFLQMLAPGKVIVHNDSVASRLQRRLEEGMENKAFVSFDVERLIDQYGYLRAVLPEVTPAVRANSGNRHVLAALVHVLDVRVNVESIADVSILRDCMDDIARTDSFYSATRADFADACGVDTALIRTASSIRKALFAGVTRMCVGGISGIRNIATAIKTAPKGLRSTLVLPEIVLAVQDTVNTLDNYNFVAGSSVLKTDVMAFSATDAVNAVKEARQLGMAVTGIQTSVATLLNGTVKSILSTIAPTGKRQKTATLTLALTDLDGYLEDGNNAILHRIRSALVSLNEVTISPVNVIADVSLHLLGSNQLLLTRVIGARPSIGDNGGIVGRQYYVDDGIYGSLCNRAKQASAPAFSVGYSHDRPLPILMGESSRFSDVKDVDYSGLECTIWGQTCDSLDKVMVTAAGVIPTELDLGDWLAFAVPMCAGNATNTGFNGYDAPLTRFMVHVGFE